VTLFVKSYLDAVQVARFRRQLLDFTSDVFVSLTRAGCGSGASVICKG
jgi:hypothetical protein